ncbi:MAG: WG repeat-containing protein [Rikenellaceae bacterium]|nr:WG repeat-containing protein [Rikenellaceae bacterium]
MRPPTINQYIDSLSQPYGLLRTLHDMEAVRDHYGDVSVCAGNYAAVFHLAGRDRDLALKCYTRPDPALHAIYDYLAQLRKPYLLEARYLPHEIYIYDDYDQGRYVDAVAMAWANGETLGCAVRRACLCSDRNRLHALAAAFDTLADDLLRQPWAHGDLKPDNIVVGPDNGLTLLDYDSLFIPPFAGRTATQLGTPSFQHPLRDRTMYDKRIDDYSIALISASLHALAENPALYAAYNRDDLLILDPAEVVAGRSSLHGKLLQHWADRDRPLLHKLTRLLGSSGAALPGLDSLVAALARHSPDVPQHDTSETWPRLRYEHGLYGYETDLAATAIEPVYDAAYAFTEGLAAVSLAGHWRFIDPHGHTVIDCGAYTQVRPFREGLAAVELNGRWGFIDPAGHRTIPPAYERVGSFHEGLAPARSGGRYGFIDTSGQWAVAPIYDHASGFREGRARVCRDGRFGYIDTRGHEIIAPVFDLAESFAGQRAAVSRDGRRFVIDLSGRELAPAAGHSRTAPDKPE